MNKNIEKEYKILVSKDQFYELLKEYPDAVFMEQTNTYYDTASFAVRNAHGAMRIRQIDQKFIFTLKMHSDEGLLEYEKEVKENSVSVFLDQEIQDLLASYHMDGDICEITTLTTKRAMIKTGLAELCFDISFYHGLTDYEIEYEYKTDHDGLSIFNALLEKIQLKYEKNCASKIKRAYDAIS